MSSGLVICSKCKREVHQRGWMPLPDGRRSIWHHCEDSTDMCDGADAVYPKSTAEIQGDWCGADQIGL